MVAWRVEHTESGDHAKEMFDAAFTTHGGQPRIVHSDGGTSMTSDALTKLFRLLGIEVSRNRPRVSNDNPYAESWFMTAKYAPTLPESFDTIEQARAWVAEFIAYYNHQHRHSGLAGHTPATVHDGTWVDVQQARQDTMDALRRANPARYRRPLKLAVPYPSFTLNITQTTGPTQNRLTGSEGDQFSSAVTDQFSSAVDTTERSGRSRGSPTKSSQTHPVCERWLELYRMIRS